MDVIGMKRALQDETLSENVAGALRLKTYWRNKDGLHCIDLMKA